MRNLRTAAAGRGPGPTLSRRSCLGLTLGLTLSALAACGSDGDDESPDEADVEPDENEPDENENEGDENENEPDENEQ